MSEDGYKKLMAELKHLETVERPKISAAIAEARDKGDLSENAEYDAAKEAQLIVLVDQEHRRHILHIIRSRYRRINSIAVAHTNPR